VIICIVIFFEELFFLNRFIDFYDKIVFEIVKDAKE